MTEKISSLIELINKEITTYNFGNEPKELYDPIRYILDLGGKRLRPLLAMLSYALYKDDYAQITKPAAAIEVFHNFTLLHDDIMDNAPLRRGKETVHEKWNDNVAILSGDVMLVKAYDLIIENNSNRLGEIIRKFNKCAAEVCEGQQLDMNFESRDDVTEEEYINMIRLKTSVLLGFSCELGGILADADMNQCQLLREIGENIGIGFQLKDDLLDVYGDHTKFGKQVGGDIISNKKTFLLINAKRLATGDDNDNLESWLNKTSFDPQEKVQAVTDIYNKLGIKSLTESTMNSYFDNGFKLMEGLQGNAEYKKMLKGFFDQLILREK